MKTAEYVRKGHPDRVCDIISDAIVDKYLEKDPDSRVAIDVFGCHKIITVGGEVTSKAEIDVSEIVRNTYKEIGYKEDIVVNVYISKQSPEIRDLANEGAGDSGICTGYATNETPEMLPLEVVLAKKICDEFDESEYSTLFGPDGKSQITLENGKVKELVFSYQVKHRDEKDFVKKLIKATIGDYLTEDTIWHLTAFVSGGFDADSGLTGRKNALWYGPSIPIGGGAFAGKDATKVDRSGAYLARNIAITFLRKLKLSSILVEIAYVIGKNKPLYIKVNNKEIDFIDGFSVKGIIEVFDLKKPIYKEASLKGHFGTNKFKWDK